MHCMSIFTCINLCVGILDWNRKKKLNIIIIGSVYHKTLIDNDISE